MIELDVVFIGADEENLASACRAMTLGWRVMIFDGCRCLPQPLEDLARRAVLPLALDEPVLEVTPDESGWLVRTGWAVYRTKAVVSGPAPAADPPATTPGAVAGTIPRTYQRTPTGARHA